MLAFLFMIINLFVETREQLVKIICQASLTWRYSVTHTRGAQLTLKMVSGKYN